MNQLSPCDIIYIVSYFISVLDAENEELIFGLDSFILQPNEDLTRTYDVPGRALVVFAVGGTGTGGTGIDFGVLGFGPRLCNAGPGCTLSR